MNTSHQQTPKSTGTTGSSCPPEQSGNQQSGQSETAGVKQAASRAGDDAKQGTRRAAESVKKEAASVAQEVQSAASDAASRAKQESRDFLDRQKSRAAEEVGHFESAIRRAGETLRDEQDDNLADYADRAARQLSRLKDYLQRQDLPALLQDVENTARRRPEMLFGGMFVAGLATARFLKASSRQRARDRRRNAPSPGAVRGHLDYTSAQRPTSAGASIYEPGGPTGDFASGATPTRSGQI